MTYYQQQAEQFFDKTIAAGEILSNYRTAPENKKLWELTFIM